MARFWHDLLNSFERNTVNIMYQKTFYATHPESIFGATNGDLRELYLVEELFAAGEIQNSASQRENTGFRYL